MVTKLRYKTTKLDWRFHGYPEFAILLEFNMIYSNDDSYSGVGIRKFQDVRDWCYTNLGPGSEVHFVQLLGITGPAPVWAWDTSGTHKRIYLTEQDFTLFQLAWA